MRKQSFIHLHGLFAEVCNYLGNRGYSIDTSDYESLGVTYLKVQKDKSEHKEAVFELVSSITRCLEESEERPPEPGR